jgi:hypothetical protein
MHGDEDGRAERDQEQVVLRELSPGDAHGAGQSRRARAEHVFGSPGPQREVLDHQHEGECREELQQLRRAIDPSQQQELYENPEEPDKKCRQRHARPEPDLRREPHGEVHPEHVQRAVGEVDDAADAEDERQPGGDEEQRARAGEPVQELQQNGGAAHSLRKTRISWSEGWYFAPSA